MLYQILLRSINNFDVEKTHNLTFEFLKRLNKAKLLPKFNSKTKEKTKFLGKIISNPIGIAGGFDKNAEYANILEKLDCGIFEFGTVTSRVCVGNPKPRIWRDIKNKNLINSVGFYNHGIDQLINNLKNWKTDKSNKIIGVSIGKHPESSLKSGIIEYVEMMQKLQKEDVDYVAINISSPNSPQLRELQYKEYYEKLLLSIRSKVEIKKPIFVKISPDLERDNLLQLLDISVRYNISGLICSNTSTKHSSPHKGGISGQDLTHISRNLLLEIRKNAPEIPVISSGGILTIKEALLRLKMGAIAIQLFSGLIFNGPFFVKNIVKGLNKKN